jgi:suppressor of fused protein SUFU
MDHSEIHDHIARHLGRRRSSGDGLDVYESASMVSVVTEGLRSRTLQSPLPVELVCSVRPGQEAEAGGLVRRFARLTVDGDVELEYDDGLLVEEPLVPDTEIRGLLAAPHPYADEMFNLVRDGDGTLRLQFVTLVPITGPEGRYLRDHEAGELSELWSSAGTDLLDLRRASAV